MQMQTKRSNRAKLSRLGLTRPLELARFVGKAYKSFPSFSLGSAGPATEMQHKEDLSVRTLTHLLTRLVAARFTDGRMTTRSVSLVNWMTTAAASSAASL
eukprot:GHVT01048349.1.p1 GENE.GHVT01048349.1~~GHVT01048349.1.p1  ORF type:complete len:100 (+),score=8.08 GHVT01048349.1:195-494(+)